MTSSKLGLVAILATLGILAIVPVQEPLPSTPVLVAAPPSLEDLRTHAVVSEANRLSVDPKLMLQVSRHENWSGDPFAWGPGRVAVGIMQINVKAHLGEFHEQCGGSDLLDRRINACYGIHIFLMHLKSPCLGDTTCALKSYYAGPRDRHIPSAVVYVQNVGRQSIKGWDSL